MVFINKNAGPIAAKLAGDRTEMDDAANRVLRAVKSVASSHVKTSAYINSLSVQKVPSLKRSRVGHVTDRIIVSDDPGALAIEYGHMQRIKGARRVRWIPGHKPMTRGMQMVVR